MHLLKVAALCLALASLAGCATFKNVLSSAETVVQAKVLNPLNDTTVFALGTTLGAAQGLIVAYAALPFCPAGEKLTPGDWCHDKQLLVTLHADMVVADSAYEQLVTLQKTHPQGTVVFGGTLHDEFSQAQQALSSVTTLTNLYLAQKGA